MICHFVFTVLYCVWCDHTVPFSARCGTLAFRTSPDCTKVVAVCTLQQLFWFPLRQGTTNYGGQIAMVPKILQVQFKN